MAIHSKNYKKISCSETALVVQGEWCTAVIVTDIKLFSASKLIQHLKISTFCRNGFWNVKETTAERRSSMTVQ